MDMQKKRQVILIIGVVLAVLYGLSNIIMSKKKTIDIGPQMHAKELNSFIEQANTEVIRHAPLPFDTYVIKRAKEKWGESPFVWVKGNSKKGETAADFFTYTGFVDFGDSKAAIINDVQYKTGEALEKEGFIVKKILSDSVIIKNIRENTEFIIPLVE